MIVEVFYIEKIDRTGIEKINIQGCRMKVIEYIIGQKIEIGE